MYLCLFHSASVWLPWNSVKINFVVQETDTENVEYDYASFWRGAGTRRNGGRISFRLFATVCLHCSSCSARMGKWVDREPDPLQTWTRESCAMRFLFFHLSLILTFSFIPSFMNFHVFFVWSFKATQVEEEEKKKVSLMKKGKMAFCVLNVFFLHFHEACYSIEEEKRENKEYYCSHATDVIM